MDVVLALCSVLCLCVWLVIKCKVPAGYAPLIVLASAALWFSIAGVAHMLWVGGLVWYMLSVAALVVTLLYKRHTNDYKKLLTPAFFFFILASVAVTVYLGVRQPLLHEWDEYSSWATFVKLMKMNNQLYSFAPSGYSWTLTQVPTMPVLAYFTQFWGSYAEWKIYAAYAFVYLAVVASLMGTVSFKQYRLAVPLGVIGLLTPWFFTIYTRQYAPRIVWWSAYGDIPAGMLFAGVLLVYYGLRREKAPLWPVFPVVAAMSLVKANTFVLALAAAGVVAIDFVLTGEKPSRGAAAKNTFWRANKKENMSVKKEPGTYTFGKRVGYGGLVLAAAAVPYMLWTVVYTPYLVRSFEATGRKQPLSEGEGGVLLQGFKMLLGMEPRSEKFDAVSGSMWQQFMWTETADGHRSLGGNSISMVGSGLFIIVLIAVLFVAAILLAKKNKTRFRAGMAFVLMAVCFVGYWVQLLFSFTFMLNDMSSYNRYIQPYYIGWFLLGIMFVAFAAMERGRIYGAAQGLALALACGMVLRTAMWLPPENSDVGYPKAEYATEYSQQKFAENVADVLGDEPQRIFFVSQGDSDGRIWFTYHYLMLPHVVDYSGINAKTGGAGGGGGTYVSPEVLGSAASTSYNVYSVVDLQAYLTEWGCTYMLVETVDDMFVESYSELFTDKLSGAIRGSTVLYRVEGEGTSLRLSPVEMEVVRA